MPCNADTSSLASGCGGRFRRASPLRAALRISQAGWPRWRTTAAGPRGASGEADPGDIPGSTLHPGAADPAERRPLTGIAPQPTDAAPGRQPPRAGPGFRRAPGERVVASFQRFAALPRVHGSSVRRYPSDSEERRPSGSWRLILRPPYWRAAERANVRVLALRVSSYGQAGDPAPVHPHLFRHARVRQIVRTTKSLPIAQKQAGWSRLQMAYLTVGDDEVRAAMKNVRD